MSESFEKSLRTRAAGVYTVKPSAKRSDLQWKRICAPSGSHNKNSSEELGVCSARSHQS